MEQSFKQFMEANGWVGRIETIVLEPEIESWIRFDSSAFAELIKGQARRRKMEASDLKTVVSRCVDKTGGWNALNKPNRPKEAFEGVLAEFGVVRSNSLYGKLAKHESLAGCQVLSFLKFKTLLQRWFAKDQQA